MVVNHVVQICFQAHSSVVGRPPFLSSCWQRLLVPHHVSLSIGCLHGIWLHSEWLIQERAREHSSIFYKLRNNILSLLPYFTGHTDQLWYDVDYIRVWITNGDNLGASVRLSTTVNLWYPISHRPSHQHAKYTPPPAKAPTSLIPLQHQLKVQKLVMYIWLRYRWGSLGIVP